MEFEYSHPELEAALREANTWDELQASLARVASLSADLNRADLLGHRMFSPGLDATVPILASRLGLQDVDLQKSNDNVCIVASYLFAQGGHSKVAHDISRLTGEEKTVLILTDYRGRQRHHQLPRGPLTNSPLRRRSTILLGAKTHPEKILELYNIIAAIRPSRIFMLTDNFDMTAPVALWPFRTIVEYVHHADHQPTLGATIPFSAHVDLTWQCHQACRAAGLAPVYAGLAGPSDTGALLDNVPSPNERLVIATCGTLLKYRGDASHTWLEYAVAALQQPNSELVHIGPVDSAFKAEVAAGLSAADLDPSRYTFTGPVLDLTTELRARNCNVYLSSYPLPGGKASVEAMSAGLIPIIPVEPDTPKLLQFDFPIDTWIKVESPSALGAAIQESLEIRRDLDGMRLLQTALAAELARFHDYVCAPATHLGVAMTDADRK